MLIHYYQIKSPRPVTDLQVYICNWDIPFSDRKVVCDFHPVPLGFVISKHRRLTCPCEVHTQTDNFYLNGYMYTSSYTCTHACHVIAIEVDSCHTHAVKCMFELVMNIDWPYNRYGRLHRLVYHRDTCLAITQSARPFFNAFPST